MKLHSIYIWTYLTSPKIVCVISIGCSFLNNLCIYIWNVHTYIECITHTGSSSSLSLDKLSSSILCGSYMQNKRLYA